MWGSTGGTNKGKAHLARFIVSMSGYTKVDGPLEAQKGSPITFVTQQTISKITYIFSLVYDRLSLINTTPIYLL